MNATPTPPVAAAGAPWFRRLTFHALLASACPLIPIPFLDDWALAWVERRSRAEALRARGVTPRAWHLDLLGWEEGSLKRYGCLLPLVWSLRIGLILLKKIFRKVLIFLTFKDCVDAFSNTFHQGFLLDRAFDRGLIDERALAGGYRLREIRQAILAACEEIDPRPIHQLIRRGLHGSRWLLLATSRTLGRFLRRERKAARAVASQGQPGDLGVTSAAADLKIDEHEAALGGLIDRLSGILWHERGYRDKLEAAFERALAAPQAGVEAG